MGQTMLDGAVLQIRRSDAWNLSSMRRGSFLGKTHTNKCVCSVLALMYNYFDRSNGRCPFLSGKVSRLNFWQLRVWLSRLSTLLFLYIICSTDTYYCVCIECTVCMYMYVLVTNFSTRPMIPQVWRETLQFINQSVQLISSDDIIYYSLSLLEYHDTRVKSLVHQPRGATGAG